MKRIQLLACCVALGLGWASTFLPDSDTDVAGDRDHAPRMINLPRVKDVRHYENEIMSGVPNIDVIVSPNDGTPQGETAVAINPKKPNIIISSSNDYRSENGSMSCYAYYSTNSGANWVNTRVPAVPSAAYNGLSDPSMTYDADGVGYYCFGAFYTNNSGQDGASAVCVSRSMDGGITWNTPVIATSTDAPNFEDKYYIAADASTGSQYKNNVYVSWTHFMNNNSSSAIFCVRSTNKGVNWLPPVQVSTTGSGHLSMPSVGPDGSLYVVWSEVAGVGVTAIKCAHSVDGGATFSQPRTVTGSTVTTLPSKMVEQGNIRMLTYPSAAVDCSPLHSGRVYVTWAAIGNDGNPHIFMSTADDKGTNWTAGYVIDEDPESATNKFHPWIACDPSSGSVSVSYYDARNDASNTKVDLYVSYSTSGGKNFTAKRITNTNFNVNPYQGGYWADYTAIAAYRGKIVPCWTDQRAGNSVGNTDVYMSIFSLGPNAVNNLAASIDAQQENSITLHWTDPTTMVSGDPLTNFNITIFRDSQFVTAVPKGAQTFVDSFLTTGSYHTYQVYVASGTDTSDLASVGAFAGGSPTPSAPVLLSVRETIDGTELRWQNPTTHTDGTSMLDLGTVYFYVDSVNFLKSTQAPEDAGKIITRVIQAPLKKFHNFNLTIGTQRGSLITESQHTNTVMWYSGAPASTLSEGFENAPVLGTNGGWGAFTIGAHSGTHALVDNKTLKSVAKENIWAMLPPFVVQPAATEFSFWDNAIVASSDSAIVEFTTDHGTTWKMMGRYTQASGSFTDSITTSPWKNEHYDMRQYVGDSVVVRFRMKTFSVGSHKQGFFVDDIAMRAPSAVAEAPMQPNIPMLVTAAPNPFSVTTTISAEGIAVPRDASDVSLRIYDIAGREIADLTPQLREAGLVRAQFNGAIFPSGMYFARLQLGARVGSAQFVLQR